MTHIDLQDLTGVWQRDSLTIENGKPFEDSNVYWLQAGDYFADMRWPLDQAKRTESLQSAFAGRTHWSQPKIRFTHHIDLTKQHLEDEGDLMMVDEKLVERGQVTTKGKTIGYKEIWSPLHTTDQSQQTNVAVVDTDSEVGYFIQVGDFAIGMNDTQGIFSAACLRRSTPQGKWRLLHSIGETERLAPLINAHLIGFTLRQNL